MSDKANDAIPNKIIQEYQYCNIKVILEIPTPNEERDKDGIKDIKRIMNTELLLQTHN